MSAYFVFSDPLVSILALVTLNIACAASSHIIRIRIKALWSAEPLAAGAIGAHKSRTTRGLRIT